MLTSPKLQSCMHALQRYDRYPTNASLCCTLIASMQNLLSTGRLITSSLPPNQDNSTSCPPSPHRPPHPQSGTSSHSPHRYPSRHRYKKAPSRLCLDTTLARPSSTCPS